MGRFIETDVVCLSERDTIGPPLTPTPSIRRIRAGRAIQFGSPRKVAIDAIDLPIASLSPELSGLSILHLSDTHFRAEWSRAYDALLETITGLNADLIAFTGDWVEDKYDFRTGLATAQRFARGLRSKFGIFTCVGNHDGDLIAPYLMDAGVNVLVGESRRILGGASSIEIIGLPTVGREDASAPLIESFGPPAANTLRLVLDHFPDHIRRVAALSPHLVLSGHTHGGQLCLPGGRPIITHDSLPKKFASGLHQFEITWLHVSRGIGCSAWNVRAFCPSEMSLIRVVSGEEAKA